MAKVTIIKESTLLLRHFVGGVTGVATSRGRGLFHVNRNIENYLKWPICDLASENRPYNIFNLNGVISIML